MAMFQGSPDAGYGYERTKRQFDLSIAVTLLILLAPLLLIIAFAIRLEDQGPILVALDRFGQNGKRFRYLKFRTMGLFATRLGTGPVFRLQYDPRLTRTGRFLRSTGLDELPALYNVLRGDMSLVGPRAGLPLEAEHYSEVQRRRLELKPGLTGYWQVFGRLAGVTDFDKMIEMDLEYAHKQSLLLDLKILASSFVLGLRRQAAY